MYHQLKSLGDVSAVAPESGQSAAAHSITIRYPLMCQLIHVSGDFHGYSVEGSPADCVKLALHQLLPQKPDLVVSGINAGENVGIHVLYSGTVAAAAEGALQGFPAVAVSLEYSDQLDFDRAAQYALEVIRTLLANGLGPGELVSVNIPQLRPGWPRGVRVARQSLARLTEGFERRNTPQGRPYYWLSGELAAAQDEPEESDLRAIREGYITVTPLRVDLTHGERYRRMRTWEWPAV